MLKDVPYKLDMVFGGAIMHSKTFNQLANQYKEHFSLLKVSTVASPKLCRIVAASRTFRSCLVVKGRYHPQIKIAFVGWIRQEG